MSKPKLTNRIKLRNELLKLQAVVPKDTPYCYNKSGRCPHRKFIGWKINKYGEYYRLIKCKLTKTSTKNEHFLLWDSCKVCGIE